MLTARVVKSAALYFMFESGVRPEKCFGVNEKLRIDNRKMNELIVRQ
jgi:hypothetical protein